ncbi:DUF4878 domain-containing protein [Catellatospora sp. KI3]|uniref:Rv0361 family membrane protein n=1 Tax=Catellatospora sp. KI3 TaxID=3041620 RepID=UPI0024826BFB|nr:DUF4878 domain-containing protein [Catellatospora sp. KI3]MDI1464550.1 DUF4878 domain-containing protein [Catellatospora sp. KI3]
MDIAGMAASAVDLIARRLQRADGHAAEQEPADTAGAVYDLVAARLRSTGLGARVLSELEQAPTDEASRAAAVQALDGELRRDPAFSDDLLNLLHQNDFGGGASAPGVADTAEGAGQVAKNGILAEAGTLVAHMRTTKVAGVSGLVVLLAALALCGATVCGAGIYSLASDSPGDVVDSLYEASADGDAEAMRSLVCAKERAKMDAKKSSTDMDDLPDGYGFTWDVIDETISGDRATVRVEMEISSPDGKSSKVTYDLELVDENGWKVCDGDMVDMD